MLAPPPPMSDSRPIKRRRRNTSGSLERGSSGDFFLRSEDMLAPLRFGDVPLGGGLDALTSSEDFMMRLKSADIVRDILLPELAAGNGIKDFETEARGLVTMHPSLFLDNHPSSFKGDARETSTSPLPWKPRTDNCQEYSMPLRSLGSKPPSLPSLESARMSSGDWVAEFITDFKDESVDLGQLNPSLLAATYRDAMAEQPTASPPPLSVPLASHLACHPRSPAPAPSAAKTDAPPSASATTKKKKQNRKRVLDETVVAEPHEGDVLSGRGSRTNMHPGNVRFRRKAFELRPEYEKSSKERKQEIADLLVDFVRDEGGRFLGKGKDGLWHEMIGNGPHCKASQVLRERIRGRNGD